MTYGLSCEICHNGNALAGYDSVVSMMRLGNLLMVFRIGRNQVVVVAGNVEQRKHGFGIRRGGGAGKGQCQADG